jgi:hypothetical protein
MTAAPDPVVRTRFDAAESPSVRVVEVLSAIVGVPPEAMSPPLAAVVDPDALDALARLRPPGRRPISTTFSYDRFDVCVRSTGEILVYDLPPTP